MSNEIKLLAEFISTSYGPYGRTKVIKAANGTCIITKEGQQLIDALYNVDNHVLVKLMLNDAKKIASSFGDGSSTFVITAAELIHTLVDQKAQSVANIQRRFALEIILEACSCNQSAIANELIRNKIWLQGHSNVDQAQFEFLCRAVLRNTISPATRDNIAELIEHLVIKWLFYSGGFAISPKVLESVCRFALKEFETLVVVGPPAGTEHCRPLSPSELILEGRQLDSGGFGTSFVIDTIVPQTPASLDEPSVPVSPRYRCICIVDATNKALTETGDGPVATLELSSMAALAASQTDSIALQSMRALVDYMITHRVAVLFSSLAVDGPCRFEAIRRGIVVVDCIPDNHLTLLASAAGSPVWASTYDLLSSCTPDRLLFRSLNDPLLSPMAPWGTLGGCKRVVIGSENHVRVFGLTPVAVSDSPSAPIRLPQLMVQGRNKHEVSLVVRLVRRGIRALLGIFSSEKSNRSQPMWTYVQPKPTNHSPLAQASSSSCANETSTAVVAPGGGLMEAVWGSVWLSIAERLANSSDTLDAAALLASAEVAAPSPFSSPSTATNTVCRPFPELSNLVTHLQAAITKVYLQRYVSASPELKRTMRLNLHLCCLAISKAYIGLSGLSDQQSSPRGRQGMPLAAISAHTQELNIAWRGLSFDKVSPLPSDSVSASAGTVIAYSAHLFWTSFICALKLSITVLRTDLNPVSITRRKIAVDDEDADMDSDSE